MISIDIVADHITEAIIWWVMKQGMDLGMKKVGLLDLDWYEKMMFLWEMEVFLGEMKVGMVEEISIVLFFFFFGA